MDTIINVCRGDKAIFSIGRLPRRKSIYLYETVAENGVNTIKILAMFKSDETAQIFERHLVALINTIQEEK